MSKNTPASTKRSLGDTSSNRPFKRSKTFQVESKNKENYDDDDLNEKNPESLLNDNDIQSYILQQADIAKDEFSNYQKLYGKKDGDGDGDDNNNFDENENDYDNYDDINGMENDEFDELLDTNVNNKNKNKNKNNNNNNNNKRELDMGSDVNANDDNDNDVEDDFLLISETQNEVGNRSDKRNIDNFLDDDDDNDNDNDDMLEIEKEAKRDILKKKKIQEESKLEMEYMQQQQVPAKTNFIFPNYKKLLKEKNEPPDLAALKKRIEEVLEILQNFKQLRDGVHSRKEYVSLLSHALARYYGYSLDLMNIFLTIFDPASCLAFLESNEQSRPLTIRCNTLKLRRRDLAKLLIDRGINIDPLAEWSKEGLKVIETQVPIGATPEYLSGYYIVQSAASFLPVLALDVKENQKILDLSAAPGGKTTHIGQLLKNTGLIIANDINKQRLKAVYGNIHRMGIHNCIITNLDGRNMHKHFHPIFDRVLLDAPCSCLGVISRDVQIKYNKGFNDVTKMATLQKELILSAIDCCKVGGFVVYSTCSISPYENEGVVYHAIENRYVKVVDTGLSFGVEGFSKFKHLKFDQSLKKTRRYYPHHHNTDGFYVAKLMKVDKGKRGEKKLVDTRVLFNGNDSDNDDNNNNNNNNNSDSDNDNDNDNDNSNDDDVQVNKSRKKKFKKNFKK